ncbi:YceI family protein [Gracilimonas sp.]|uniref:YceI family protein n=1 Tax=Gracilimonas sp. TaxID=1974203 RepID=UPI0028711E8D|nr:YceI family protein [Gracilimonas sp.]
MIIKALLLCLSVLVAENPDTTSTDTLYYSNSGYVEFSSNVPLHSFTGESNHLTGLIDFEENLIDFYIDLNTLKTGIGKRDRDMYETLNTQDHPFAEFTGSFKDLEFRNISDKQPVTTVGEFTINGKTQTVSIDGALSWINENLVLEAGWSLLLSDYNIEPPGVLFYKVDDIQEISLNIELKPQSKEAFYSDQ